MAGLANYYETIFYIIQDDPRAWILESWVKARKPIVLFYKLRALIVNQLVK